MATVKIDKFGGIAPRQHPTQLADGMATVAHNCRLETGKLVPLRQPQLVKGANNLMEGGLDDVAKAESMHIWRKADGSFDFLLFGGVTWSAPGNVAADDLTRLIVSGDRTGDGTVDEPVVYLRDNNAKVVHPIVKEPMGYPLVSRAQDAEELTDNRRYTRFFLTWVDKYGMESPVSAPSRNYVEGEDPADEDFEYMDGDTVYFQKPEDIPVAAVKLRVYKVVTGMEEGRVQFVYEIEVDALAPSEVTGFSFKVKDEDAGETMPEIEAPPTDLLCIRDVPGAFYCGFSASAPKTVCFSDIDLLYSWPIAYRYDIADNIVALAVTSNTVFALTDGWPYVLSGTAPESMTVAKIAGPAACVSARGVCVYGNAVYFVSNAGLMTIYNDADAGTVCRNLTEKIFTKEQWLALNPASCVMGQHKGALFLYFTLGASRPAFVPESAAHVGLTVSLTENVSIAVSTHDEAATCLCVDAREDKMYFVREGV